MTAGGRLSQVRALFDELVGLAPPERSVRLARLAAGDDWLRKEVESLLQAEAAAGDRFEHLPGLLDDLGPEDPSPGTRIGPWRIVREIGRGGMGAVFEAVRDDAAFSKRVAIKLVPRERLSPQAQRRFEHERQILARLEHRNIASLLDGGTTEAGRSWFAMEYVEGERIDRYCDRQGLGVRERLQLMRQVCAAVQYAHQHLVVHRDIKPGNVLVTADGTVKLLDFGIAKLIDPDTTESLTETGTVPLTTSYASPEQLRGEPVGTATDTYSLGVLLYELLSGRPPFLFANLPLLEIRRRILEETPLAPSASASTTGDRALTSTLPRAAGAELDQIVLMALRKEPARRYVSAEQFSEDLLRFLAGEPVRAQPDSVGYRTRKFVARNRALVTALIVIGLTLATGLAVTAWQLRTGRRERERTELTNRFLRDVLVASAQAPAGGGQRTMADALDAASRRLDAPELAAHPEVRASIQQLIGSSYLSLGMYEPAERHLREALAAQAALFGDDNLETVKTLFSLAQVALSKADYDAARAFYSRRLDVLRREYARGRLEPGILVSALSDLALLQRARGNSAAAEASLREAMAVADALPDGERSAGDHVRSLLVLALLDRGKLEEAETDARRLLAGMDGEAAPVTQAMSSGLTILGSVLMERGKLAEAESSLVRAERIYRQLFDTNYVSLYDNLRLQAQAAYLQGHLDDAGRLIDRVLVKYAQLTNPNYISYATALTLQGLVLNAQGRGAEAEQVLRDALRLRHQNLPATHYMTALTEGALGEVLTTLGRLDEAEPLLVGSRDGLRASQDPGDPRIAQAQARLDRLHAERLRLAG